MFSSGTSDGFIQRVWDGVGSYVTAHDFFGHDYQQYYASGRLFQSASTTSSQLDLYEDVATNAGGFRFEMDVHRFRMFNQITPSTQTAFDFDGDNAVYTFRTPSDSGFFEISLDTINSTWFALQNFDNDLEWRFQSQAGSLGFVVQPAFGFTTNSERRFKINGFLGVRQVAAGSTQGAIGSTLAASAATGHIFWNTNRSVLQVSDGSNWYDIDTTIVPS